MSTEPTTGGTESEDTQVTNPTEEVTDDAGTSTTGEGSTEESSKTLSAEEKRQHIVDGFRKKLESGELKKEDIPEKQAWVLKEIEDKQQEAQPDIKELVAKAAKEEAQKLFKEEAERKAVEGLWNKVADAGATKATMNAIKKEFDSYKDSLGEQGALELAVRLSGLKVSSEAVKRSKMMIHDNLDSVSDAPSPDEVITDQKNQSDEALMKAMRTKKGL